MNFEINDRKLEYNKDSTDIDPRSFDTANNILRLNSSLSNLSILPNNQALYYANQSYNDQNPLDEAIFNDPGVGHVPIVNTCGKQELFWSTVADNYSSDYSSEQQQQPPTPSLLLLISNLRAGIEPTRMRGPVWKALSNSNSLHLEPLYEQLKNEPSPYEKLILRDVSRTFPNSDMFSQESGQRALERVLRAYSLYDADVGYCQGLAFLVGPLLLNMSEQDAFCVFVRLMETYGLRTLFTLSMEGLHLRLFQFDVLLLEQIPELHSFLRLQGIHPQMYASQWFLTIFAYIFPLPLIYRIYDVMFVEGVTETVMRIALSLMKKSTRRIMALTEFEDIMDYLSTKLGGDYDTVIQDSVEFGSIVTRPKLTTLEEKYRILQGNCAKSLNNKPLSTQETDNAPLHRSKGWFGTTKRTKKPKQSTFKPPETPPQQTQTKNKETTILHQQIEDLVSALSHVEKDNTLLREEVANLIQKQQHANVTESPPRHAYHCGDKANLDHTASPCHCELKKLLAAATVRINDLEISLLQQQQHRLSYSSSPTLSRSGSTSSDRSSYSSSSSSTFDSRSPTALQPSVPYTNYIPLTEDELSRHQQTITKQEVMLPSSYYYIRNTTKDMWNMA